ncbi:MAG: hypothetical protein E6Q26_00110 [Acinetobacter sp.]|nr:MAG: hypothetical protein E6Q26_00110 [Acinetobacter sp.]
MKNIQHNYTRAGVILFMVALPALGWAAQSLTESTLALQAVTLKHAVPSMIQQAQQDDMKPEAERWRAQRLLSDGNLREIRISMLTESVLSPYEEQKKNALLDVREKKKATMKPHDTDSDRYMIYEFESPNVKTERMIYSRR